MTADKYFWEWEKKPNVDVWDGSELDIKLGQVFDFAEAYYQTKLNKATNGLCKICTLN